MGFKKTTSDLTVKKLAEDKLLKSEERNRLLIDAVKEYAIFMLNPEGIISSWNKGVKRLYGYSEEGITGKHFSIFYSKEKVESLYPQYELEQAKKHGQFEDEGYRIRKDGSSFYANVIITALYDEQKNLIGFSKITRDLSERKEYEENLQKLNKELEEQVKARTKELAKRTEELERSVRDLKRINNDLDSFIYTASHDLKAPISNLEGLFYALYEELGGQINEKPALKDFKDLIEISIKRFQSTILELTEIAKIQKESIQNSEEIDLLELIEDIKISLLDQIKKNDVQININLNECHSIRFIKKNLKSIIYNLISNAIKYKSPLRNPLITINCECSDRYYILSCKDNGLGIKNENKSKMFTMFKRFHDHVEGSGVGLYIVKRIIENAGGKIEVESTEGIGSCFIAYIPKL